MDVFATKFRTGHHGPHWGRRSSESSRRHPPPSRLATRTREDKQVLVQFFIESDALQANARGFQSSRGIELTGFVDILRRGVLSEAQGIFYYRLCCLSQCS